MIALCAVLCGGEDCSDMALFRRCKEPFLRQFLRLKHGISSHDTVSGVFRLLDPEPFHAALLRFMRRCAEKLQGVVAIDGKTLRHSFDRASGKSPLHMVSAGAADQRLVRGQLAVDGQSNEITAVPKLLEMLPIKGCIVTADALNCQRANVAQVVAQGADDVLALKGNQDSPHDEVRGFLDDPQRPPEATHITVDGEHRRIETRTSRVSTRIDWRQDVHAWPGLAGIRRLTRSREIAGKMTTETAYDLLGTPLIGERLGEVVRAHWGIENGRHWVLDVTMDEDQTRNRLDHGPQNIALLRRVALSLANSAWPSSKAPKAR